jgi:hypothetical protein
VTFDLADALMLTGVVLVIGGVALYSVPAAVIVAGVLITFGALLAARKNHR